MLTVLRRVLFWSHLVCGVAAGIVILIMCVTGVALTYQKEMQWWADTRDYRAVPAAGVGRASVEDILAAVRAFDAAAAPTTIAWRAQADAPAAVVVGARTLYVNPYTATVYGEGTGQGMRQFFTTMTNWHRYVAMAGDSRPTGKAITGAANLMFLFIVLSGMYLWWPTSLKWSHVRNVTWFRGGLRAKARDFNWHNTIGFWSAVPLAVVVYSATVISYPWSSNLVYRVMGEEPPAPAAGRAGGPGAGRGGNAIASPRVAQPQRAGIDRLVDRAMDYREHWAMVTMRVPSSSDEAVLFTIDGGDAGQPNLRGTLTIAASSQAAPGAARAVNEKWEDFSAQTPGRRARTFLRFAHTGEIWGIPGQTIAGVVSAGGAVLVYTGLALAVRRLAAWLKRATRNAASPATSTSLDVPSRPRGDSRASRSSVPVSRPTASRLSRSWE
jgi:uncharacterized iron-regulated membrane protein